MKTAILLIKMKLTVLIYSSQLMSRFITIAVHLHVASTQAQCKMRCSFEWGGCVCWITTLNVVYDYYA